MRYIVLLFILTTNLLFAQTGSSPFSVSVFPPSPNAASLGVYGQIQVGNYTGTPNVSIPLHTVSIGDLSLPISLSYNAGGVKVEEIAPWVGLGWSLNAGGVITRTIRGKNDESAFGYISSSNPDQTLSAYPGIQYNYFKDLYQGSIDGEPDMFYFNFGGRSGRFVFDKQGNPMIIPFQKIKIEKNVGADIGSWLITTEDGVKYTFAQIEYTGSATWCNGEKTNDLVSLASSWYLTEIMAANQIDKINFYYEQLPSQTYKTINSETRTVEGATLGGQTTTFCNSKVVTSPVKLSKISTLTSEITFTKGLERCDFKGDYVLDKISIKDLLANQVIKTYQLDYKYSDGSLVNINTICSTLGNDSGDLNDYYKRLMLLSITEISPDNKSNPPHRFEYISSGLNGDIGLPSRLSYAQDHWGFYNGAISNTTLISANPYSTYEAQWANREADINYAKLGSLQKITYPTGGSTSFEYEAHDLGEHSAYYWVVAKSKSVALDVRPHLQSFYGSFVETDKFTINSSTGSVMGTLIPGFPTSCTGPICPNATSNPHCVNGLYQVDIIKYVSMTDNVGTVVAHFNDITDFVSSAGTNVSTQTFPNGIYGIKHTVVGNIDNYHTAFCFPYVFTFKYNESVPIKLVIGGLRIAKVKDYDPINNQTRTNVYEYKNDDGKSSGWAVNLPDYVSTYTENQVCPNQMSWGPTYTGDSNGQQYINFKSSSNQPLMSTQGSLIGYGQVTVYYGEDAVNGKGIYGKSVYTYYTPNDFPDYVSLEFGGDALPSYATRYTFPFAPIDSRDWLRGMLKTSIDFKKETGVYKKTKEVINEYNFYKQANDRNYKEIFGWKVDRKTIHYSFLYPSKIICPARPYEFATVRYRIRSGYYEPKNTVERVYDPIDPAKYMETITDYEYSASHLQLTKTSSTNSEGYKNIQKFKYPLDYNYAGIPSLNALMTKNIINPPIEQQTWLEKAGVQQMLSGKITEYDPIALKPAKIYVLETNTPLSSLNNETQTSGKYNNLLSDTQKYKAKALFSYDPTSLNLRRQERVNDIASVYLYDYSKEYPIAQISNIASDNTTYLNEIAYSGFEDAEKGGWSYVGTNQNSGISFCTGKNHYVLNTGNISKTGLTNTKTYRVSLWANGSGNITINNDTKAIPTGGGWQYMEWLVVNPSTVTISSTSAIKVDELRLCPQDALMTTYTYQPLIGMSSSTDANNFTTYYEYDSFNRLKLVRDKDGKIVKQYQYHYKGQTH